MEFALQHLVLLISYLSVRFPKDIMLITFARIKLVCVQIIFRY